MQPATEPGPEHSQPSDDWHQRAGFSMFVDMPEGDGGSETWRTRIYHEESGEEIVLDGADTSGWLAWILERIQTDRRAPTPDQGSRSRPQQSAQPTAPTTALLGGPIALDLTGLRVFDTANGEDGRQRIRVEAELAIDGLAEAERSLGAALLRLALDRWTI